MALLPTDPWYVALPDSRTDQPANRRYKRALALSQMRREIAIYEGRPDLARRRAAQIAYRKYCIGNWQRYLDGDIEPPTGRKMTEE